MKKNLKSNYKKEKDSKGKGTKKKADSKTNPDALIEAKDFIRQQVVTILWKHENITPKNLLLELKSVAHKQYGAEMFDLYYAVRTELEQKGLIEIVPNKKPEHLRMVFKNKPDIDM